MMKRLLVAAALAVMAVPAQAAMNIQQSPDGSADWVGSAGAGPKNCVGGVTHPVYFSNMANLTTKYLMSTITNAFIQNVWGTLDQTSAGRVTISVFAQAVTNSSTGYGQATFSPIRFRSSVGTLSRAELQLDAQTLTIAGPTVRTLSTLQQAGAASLENNTLGHPNHMIAVTNSQGLTTTANVSGQVFIRVCPR
jgi:hypothetical protein